MNGNDSPESLYAAGRSCIIIPQAIATDGIALYLKVAENPVLQSMALFQSDKVARALAPLRTARPLFWAELFQLFKSNIKQIVL